MSISYLADGFSHSTSLGDIIDASYFQFQPHRKETLSDYNRTNATDMDNKILWE